MTQIEKLDNLIKKILKEELEKKSLIKEKLGVAKKISDAQAVKILNNKKYDIETTIDYDRQYRYRATDILMSGNLKADSFDNIEGEDKIRLSVYTPGKVDPFFLTRDVKNRSWSMEEFEGNEVNDEEIKEELENSLKEDYRIEALKKEIDSIKKNYDLGLLTDNERKKQLEYLKSKYKDLMTVARLKGIDMNEEEKELDEQQEEEYITPDGTARTLTPLQKQKMSKAKAGSIIKYRKAGTTVTTQGTLEEEKEEEMKDAQLESAPTGTEIAGQVAEILDKLKAMSEGSDDVKKKKLADRVVKQMESAKAALETLTAHETMLEEKQQQEEEKDAEKHVKGFKKHLTKLVKEPAAVEKIAAKMDAKKMAELKKKLKSGELDEEKLARVMLQHSLKEGWVKKK